MLKLSTPSVSSHAPLQSYYRGIKEVHRVCCTVLELQSKWPPVASCDGRHLCPLFLHPHPLPLYIASPSPYHTHIYIKEKIIYIYIYLKRKQGKLHKGTNSCSLPAALTGAWLGITEIGLYLLRMYIRVPMLCLVYLYDLQLYKVMWFCVLFRVYVCVSTQWSPVMLSPSAVSMHHTIPN